MLEQRVGYYHYRSFMWPWTGLPPFYVVCISSKSRSTSNLRESSHDNCGALRLVMIEFPQSSVTGIAKSAFI